MKVQLFSIDDILHINQKICTSVKQDSICMDKGKIESALGAAFYPGDYPFRYGGIPRVAGALCFFLIKAHAFMDANKRTAAVAATMFMDLEVEPWLHTICIEHPFTLEQARRTNKPPLLHHP